MLSMNAKYLHNYFGRTKIISYANLVKYCTNKCPCDPCGGGTQGPSSGSNRVVYKPYVPKCPEDHDHKNMKLKRPMSPHLDVYGPTLPAMTSILQRITGTILTFYAIVLSGGTLFLSNGIDSFVLMIQSLHLSGPFILLFKLALGLPFAFHYAFGIRFCVWNTAKCLSKKQVYSTAYQAFALTGIIAFVFAFLL